MQDPIRVAVTGPAGQIGYSILFRIAAGAMLGRDRPVHLSLLERDHPTSQSALKGVMMELEDCAFPLLAGMSATTDPKEAFRDCDIALLIGARPRGPGMERADLLESNARIFLEQGRALDEVAKRSVKVLVVGNPCNTNAWIAMKSAPSLSPKCFSSMVRLDQNRTISMLAAKTGAKASHVHQVAIWGNHSPTVFPDLSLATVDGARAFDLVDRDWYEKTLIPTVSRRGSAIIQSRGASSAARQPSTPCATGCRAPWANGCRWACLRTAATASPKDSSAACPACAATATTTSSRASASMTSHARASSARSANSKQSAKPSPRSFDKARA